MINPDTSDELTSRNRLAGTGSPYLEQHADNPVHWQPWSGDVLAAARASDRPVLISIGYSTCHWCHVMAHQCFEDADAAALMNRELVNIKVDREQHPGVDALYMEAAQVLNGSGGWPLNVFADGTGRPFLAVTYLPPERWTALVTEVARIWRTDRDRIGRAASSLAAHLSDRRIPDGPDPAVLPDAMMDACRRQYDAENPGFPAGGSSMKFPPSMSIDWLLEHGALEGRNMAVEILTAMMDSGLHDRVGGGFHRYSVDSHWRVPHFEKMTYDNAQLMGLYARASVLRPPDALSEDLLSAARNTADWFLREMRVGTGDGVFSGYASATDADDPVGEGAFFAWPPSALREVLGEAEAARLAARWDINGEGTIGEASSTGHFEPVASWIPHPRGAAGYPGSFRTDGPAGEGAARDALLLRRLREVRSGRAAPARDDKVLTDQNALVLEGFSRLARYDGGEAYRDAADELARLVTGRIGESSPRVSRATGLGAYITDYGYLAMGLTGYFGLCGDAGAVRAAEVVALEAVNRLSDGRGTYYSTPEGGDFLYRRTVEDYDGPSPAGAHALGIAFIRLYMITGNPLWRERAGHLLTARAAVAASAPAGAPTLVRLASLLREPHTFVVAGPPEHPLTAELLLTVRRSGGPDVLAVPADAAAAGGGSDWIELAGRVGLDVPQLLVCREGSCLKPAFTADEAVERLKSAGITVSHAPPGGR